MNQCAAHDVCTREGESYSRKILLFTLLITAVLRSRLRSKCRFLALCPRQSKTVLTIKRKWQMICSWVRSNLVSFLYVTLSPPCELPVESHMQIGGGISALTTDGAEQQWLLWGDCCRTGLSRWDVLFPAGQRLGCDFVRAAVNGAVLQPWVLVLSKGSVTPEES